MTRGGEHKSTFDIKNKEQNSILTLKFNFNLKTNSKDNYINAVEIDEESEISSLFLFNFLHTQIISISNYWSLKNLFILYLL